MLACSVKYILQGTTRFEEAVVRKSVFPLKMTSRDPQER